MDALPEERMHCTYDFWLCLQSSTSEVTLRRFHRLMQQITRPAEQPQQPIADWTHFVCLTWRDLAEEEEAIREACKGCDAAELRVDLLADHSPAFLQRQMAILREALPEHIEIVYTVRSSDEGGNHPSENMQQYVALLREGLRAGVDWLDVEASKASQTMEHLALHQFPLSKLLVSKHDLHNTHELDEDYLRGGLEACAAACPGASMLKFVTVARSWESAMQLSNAAMTLRKRWTQQPFICLAMGEAGSMTRVFNRVWTPVTHPRLPSKAAPGQLSLAEITNLRCGLNILARRQFFLFGSDISRSPSPAMHNAAFQWFQYPYKYELFQTSEVEHVANAIRAHDFGGASVTMPYKELVMSHLDEISGAARVIGAVNTIAVVEDNGAQGNHRQLVGFNTDWIGIFRPIRRLLRTDIPASAQAMLIIGAGGTARAAAYAGQQLGLRLLVCNRTVEKAQEIALDFGGQALNPTDLNNIAAEELAVIISTIPPSAQTELPERLFRHKVRVVLQLHVCDGFLQSVLTTHAAADRV